MTLDSLIKAMKDHGIVEIEAEGVKFDPTLLVIILGSLPSRTATAELVVPRSIPITFDINKSPFLLSNILQ